MSRIEDILTRVRDTLVDTQKKRWSDPRLLRVLDEGQKDIVLRAKLLRTKATLPINIHKAVYDLPSDCYRLIRATYKNKALRFASHTQMDGRLNSRIDAIQWEDKTGNSIKNLVFDKLNTKTIKVYPIIPSSDGPWEYESDVNNPSELLSNLSLGSIVNATGLDIDIYGSAVDMDVGVDDEVQHENIDPTVDGAYGICFDFESTEEDVSEGFVIYYIKKPVTISSVSQELEVDDEWDTALKHYVTGMVLKDNREEQDRQMGNEELTIYNFLVEEAKEHSTLDFVASDLQGESSYNNGLN